MGFSFSELANRVSAAAKGADAVQAIRAILQGAIADPDAIFAATPQGEDDETMILENDHVSIWRCRFQPHEIMPPHEHKMPVLIATYSGTERSLIYQRRDGALEQTGTVDISAGQVRALPDDVIHAVVGAHGRPSDAIHVYLGPLMQIERDLFDWDTGASVTFTMDAFEALKRPADPSGT